MTGKDKFDVGRQDELPEGAVVPDATPDEDEALPEPHETGDENAQPG